MAGGIDANASLDYIEFQIFPSQNRYEACVCYGDRKETLTSGALAQLLRHSEKVKTLNSDRCKANFKLEPPENLRHAKWFTKSTVLRFLHIIGSSDTLDTTNAVLNEISQLEEAREFHLSIYTKDPHAHHQIGGSDGSYKNSAASTEAAACDAVSADASKNELLRAMDLRLTALRGELATALNKAAGATCSPEETINLEKLSHYFGSTVLRKTLHRIIEKNHENLTVDFSSDDQSLSRNDSGNHGGGLRNKDNNVSIPSNADTPVKYGVSPAKVAQLERQSSSESEELSDSTEEDQPSIERSRPVIRSASPRRSASPMRRVQIGRSGTRRSTPLNIKSLNYFPARERIVSQKDAAAESSDEEGSEGPARKADNNVRMSVQDAISLFENKQKEQIVDIQKARSLLNASVSANKSVLRRWSAGMGECSSKCQSDLDSDNSVPAGGADTMEGGEIAIDSSEAKVYSEHPSDGHPAELLVDNVQPNSEGESGFNPVGTQEDALKPETTKVNETLSASAEWSRQKESELNQLLMKMMETKPVKNRSSLPELSKNLNVPTERRGGFYDSYKKKRDEKLRGDTPGNQAEKGKQFRVKQQILDEKKAVMAPKVSNGIVGRENVKKPQKPLKSASQSLISKKPTPSTSSKQGTELTKPKKETSKPVGVKKTSQKASPLPATRKSWPSMPSTRGASTSPATTTSGMTATGSTTIRRRSQPTPSGPRSSPKVEDSQLRPKPVRASPSDVTKNTKGLSPNKMQTVAKTGKTTKTKVQADSAGTASSEKPSFHGKVTKKSSVVPVETKPFLRKGSRIGSGIGPNIKTKPSPQPEESLRECNDLVPLKENASDLNSSDTVNEQSERNAELTMKAHADTIAEMEAKSPLVCEAAEIPPLVISCSDDISGKMAESSLKNETEEEMLISPSAWVEIEEQEHQPVLCNDSISEIDSPTNFAPVKTSSPRIRHSLSQMLLEENSEPDVIEWGNAEEPSSMIYQKDAPKGLKRLLKFARKSKTDANSTGWSSPSVFSEGEDDGEESKAFHKKNAESLLKKATLRAKNDGHQKTSCENYDENPSAHELFARANITITDQSLSRKLPDGQTSASVTTSKASRSFFSLSAFKGGKQNETKFR